MDSRRTHIELTSPLLVTVGRCADAAQLEAYVVGGYVRDHLLGLGDRDIDVVVLGDAPAFARDVADALGKDTVVTFERFGTAQVPLGHGKIEFVQARSERYTTDSRKPLVESGSLQDDLVRRDFTVNAMAAGLNASRFGELVDPFDGQTDLERRILRTPRDPASTFEDDPLRIMRAFRFAAQLGFTIDPAALEAVHTMKDRLSIVSQERITDELLKLLMTAQPSNGLRPMQDAGVMQLVFPELSQMAGVDQRKDHHHKDVFLHTCIVVDNIARMTDNLWLRFTALVHDIAKPRTKAFKEGIGWTFHGHEELGARMMKGIFRRLRLPLESLAYVEKLVRLHLRPMALVDDIVTDSAVRRLVFESGNDIDDLMLLCRADITSKNPKLVDRYLRNYDVVMQKIREVEEKDRLRNWQPPVKGDEIMEVCGIPPGRKVGELKKAIEEAVLEGIIPNDHNAALDYLMKVKEGILRQESAR
jgi:poly(A) polymerase